MSVCAYGGKGVSHDATKEQKKKKKQKEIERERKREEEIQPNAVEGRAYADPELPVHACHHGVLAKTQTKSMRKNCQSCSGRRRGRGRGGDGGGGGGGQGGGVATW